MRIKRTIISVLTVLALAVTLCFTGCTDTETAKNIESIEKTMTVGSTDTYTITYTDGTTYNFTVTNGEDGDDLSVSDLYALYQSEYPDADYEDFLKAVISVEADSQSLVASRALLSSLKVYSEFTESYQYISGNGWYQQIKTAYKTQIYCGSAVIYAIGTDYTYMITNYHVLYDSSEAIESSKLSRKITCYLYGSEGEPTATSEKDSYGCVVYDYGDYAIECDYVGGSVTADIAVIKAKTSDLKSINENISAVDFADSYHVGQSAIAIGNAENEGISVTSGIVSVDNELISYSIDGTTRSYRSMRIDTAIYGGNSGGGLFDSEGKLIGITNAGDNTDQNINYAIPVNIVKPVVENIMYYADGTVKALQPGVTVSAENSKYVIDESLGYGSIYEDIVVESVTSDSVADLMGLQEGDILTAITINDETYPLKRYFDISDRLYTIRSGDRVYFTLTRDGSEVTSTEYTVATQNLVTIS